MANVLRPVRELLGLLTPGEPLELQIDLRALPVIDAACRILGLIDEHDVAKALLAGS